MQEKLQTAGNSQLKARDNMRHQSSSPSLPAQKQAQKKHVALA